MYIIGLTQGEIHQQKSIQLGPPKGTPSLGYSASKRKLSTLSSDIIRARIHKQCLGYQLLKRM